MLRMITAMAGALLALALAGCATAAAQEEPREPEPFSAVEDVAQPEEVETFEEEQAEEPPVGDSEPISDDVWVEEYYEPVYEYAGPYIGSEATTIEDLLNGQGRAYDEEGQSYTYYGDVCGHLDIPGENVDENGVIHDGDGYIVVAADSYERGAIIETPYGEAKNYDSGGGYGNVDIYTNR